MAISETPAAGGTARPDESKDMPPRDRDQHAVSAARAESKAEAAEAAATRPLPGADSDGRKPLTSRGHLEDPAGRDEPTGGPAAAGDQGGDRRQRISERAYYRAEQRGFSPGGEDGDWFDAEKEIDEPGR